MANLTKLNLRAAALPLAAAVLLLAGCGDNDTTITIDTGEGQIVAEFEGDNGIGEITITTDEGEAQLQFGGDLPEDFPEEFVYPGAVHISSFSVTAEEGGVILATFDSDDDLDDILKFFEQALLDAGLGDEVIRATMPQGSMIAFGDGDSGGTVIVFSGGGEEAENRITITLAAAQ